MTIHALDKNLLLMQVPVSYRDRPAGSVSKLHTFRDGARVLKTIFMLYKDYRPLRFFLAAALVLTLISLSLFLPVFHEYLATGLVPKMPTLVTSGFLGGGRRDFHRHRSCARYRGQECQKESGDPDEYDSDVNEIEIGWLSGSG